MAHSSLEQVSKEIPLNITWKAFELRPQEAQAQIDPAWEEEKKKQIEAHWPQVQQMAHATFGLDLKRGPWGIDTRLTHVGAKVVRRLASKEAEERYHRAVFAAYWHEQQDIGQEETLLPIAESVGVEKTAFLEGLRDEEDLAEVLNEEHRAHNLGIQGVPAMVIAGRYLLSGAQPPERLAEILTRYTGGIPSNGSD